MEISWDTATRTTNHNVRVWGVAIRIVRDGGQWEYRRNETARRGTWWAHNLETGEILRTGVQTMPEVERFMYDLDRARRGTPRYAIARGPQRARGGHQRFVGAGQFA